LSFCRYLSLHEENVEREKPKERLEEKKKEEDEPVT
jgi:hypothetical protein